MPKRPPASGNGSDSASFYAINNRAGNQLAPIGAPVYSYNRRMLKKFNTPRYPCPHCDQPCISFLRKQALGPATSAACRSCGKRVSVGPGALLSMLPILAAFLIARHLDLPTAAAVALLLTGACLAALLSHLYVPLVRR